MFWRPLVKEISDWVEDTYLKFAEQENKDPHRNSDDFLQRYIFFYIYEIFFGSIHIELHQWLSRLTELLGNVLCPFVTVAFGTVRNNTNNWGRYFIRFALPH